ncbi:uL30 family ribosomal protein [Candidatus Woesearchaeota archaeon]|nr:uL30 family ribosomal protein [Candidatus Woesearchaeota archaeon]
MKEKTNKGPKNANQLAAVRVRGLTGIKTKIKDTMNILRLYKNNYCCILPNTPIYVGMLMKAKDYITWGEIDDETFKMLVEKRGEEFSGRETDSKGKIKYNDFVVINNKKIKKYFRLNAPRKGFGRKGIKNPFTSGGALGYRGEKINDLIKRMV